MKTTKQVKAFTVPQIIFGSLFMLAAMWVAVSVSYSISQHANKANVLTEKFHDKELTKFVRQLHIKGYYQVVSEKEWFLPTQKREYIINQDSIYILKSE